MTPKWRPITVLELLLIATVSMTQGTNSMNYIMETENSYLFI